MFPFDCVGMTTDELIQAQVDELVWLTQGFTVVYIEDEEDTEGWPHQEN